MITGYTKNLSVQILISLLRKHGIKKAILSPGTTNLEFMAGLQYAGDFELYSSIDERSAAYMACGIAEETGEPVVIACTEATASRNYFPGLTEAYYRKLPIIAVTGVHRYSQIGNLQPQVIDRSVSPKDLVVCKTQLPIIKDGEDIRNTELLVNKALLSVKGSNPGPVHIDLPCCNDDYDFSSTTLYDAKKIERYEFTDNLPNLPTGKVAVFMGSNRELTKKETELLDKFCECHDSVVFCDHTSGYYGKYAFNAGLLSSQSKKYEILNNIECVIHIGEPAADGLTMSKMKSSKETWRISMDGELRDTFGNLTKVFQMPLVTFLSNYITDDISKDFYLKECLNVKEHLEIPINKMPLSNIYTAAKLSKVIPSDSIIHIGVSNSIRAWTLFDFSEGVKSYSNVGCRGIDGVISSAMGASLVDRSHIHFCVVGDLMFYYDMNALGNRDISGNLRILLINNNGGGIFKLGVAPGHNFFGDEDTNKYIAAAEHFKGGDKNVIKNYVESLGFTYMSACNKEEFDSNYLKFASKDDVQNPILFEVFTKDSDDREAFEIVTNIDIDSKDMVKKVVKQVLGDKGTQLVKQIISK